MANKEKNNMRDLIKETNGWVAKSHKDDEANPDEEGRQVNPGEQKTGRKSDTASSMDDAAPTAEDSEGQTSPSWDFFMSHCNSFDPRDKGVSVRIDRKVKKSLDLAKARMSKTVSMKGMVSAIVLHFLTEHEAMFEKQQQEMS